MPDATSADALDDAVALLDLSAKAATAYNREDLGRRIAAARERLADPTVRVLVVGEFKQGKSSLVNALLGTTVCAVDDDVATCVPTIVRYGDVAMAEVHLVSEDDGESPGPRVQIDVRELDDHVSELGNRGNVRGIERAEVSVPSELLRTGLSIVDTPGVGGLGSKHGAMTMGILPTANAVILVSDASQEYTDPELRFLQRARDLCPNLIAALTKIDLYPEWRRIADIDAGHLRNRGFDVRLFPFSSSLRTLALDTGDGEAEVESGFPAIASFLRDEVVGGAQRLSIRSAASDVLAVAEQLGAAFAAEHAVLRDDASGDETLGRLEEARAAAARLMGQAARWQYTLTDGVADLNADIDHDFRNRMRSLTNRAEDAIDDADPAQIWEEFEPWLEQAMAHEVVETFAFLSRRTQALAATVAAHFAEAESDVVVQLDVASPLDAVEAARRTSIDLGKVGIASSAMTALRGSYGGVLMFGMIARMIGVAALNPLVGVAGILMGGKAIKEERERALKQRRQDAKAAVRKYIDEVGFSVGKEVRDAGRRTHRELRDAFAERAEALQRSTAAAVTSTKQALEMSAAERTKRRKSVETELRRISALRDRALALAPDLDR